MQIMVSADEHRDLAEPVRFGKTGITIPLHLFGDGLLFREALT
jgi:hypothetical protein